MSHEALKFDKIAGPLIEKAKQDGAETMWDREAAMKTRCGFGDKGLCCRHCNMGPCRISPVAGKGAQKGICGATADTIIARNYARIVAAGSSSHSDHARSLLHTLHMTAPDGNYQIKDEEKLLSLAKEYEVETEGRDIYDIAHEVAEVGLMEFGKPFGTQRFIKRATEGRQKLWKELNVEPRAIDREVVSIMHSTHIGCASDMESIYSLAVRSALSNGWGGSMIGTDVSDILFGTPTARQSEANLGCLEDNMVNILLHGHEPGLSEMIVFASQDPDIMQLAKDNGAEGINLVGMCCTGNEVLMRHGVRLAGTFYQQELAVITGALEAVVVDVQCIFPALVTLSECYHTKFIATSPKAQMEGARYIEFDEERALEVAKEIVTEAILNYKNRDRNKVLIPQEKNKSTVGFSINTILGGLDKVVNTNVDQLGTVKPLADCIMAGVLRGAAGVVGCNNPKVPHDNSHLTIIKEMIKNDVIVVVTGCAAQAAAKAGLLQYEAKELAGRGLKEVCERVGIPPVLHMGSCVDNTRILRLVTEVAKHLGVDTPVLPVVGAAPEWMSEKAVSIGTYFVSSGVDVFLGVAPPVTGSERFTDYLTNKVEDIYGAKFTVNEDPIQLAQAMLDRIEEKRTRLGI